MRQCSSRNNPHCAPRHVIYYYLWVTRFRQSTLKWKKTRIVLFKPLPPARAYRIGCPILVGIFSITRENICLSLYFLFLSPIPQFYWCIRVIPREIYPLHFFCVKHFIFRSLLKNIWYVFFYFNMICKIFEKWIFENYRLKKSDRLNFFITKKVLIKKMLNISSNIKLIPNFEMKYTEKLFQWIFINKLAIFINK